MSIIEVIDSLKKGISLLFNKLNEHPLHANQRKKFIYWFEKRITYLDFRTLKKLKKDLDGHRSYSSPYINQYIDIMKYYIDLVIYLKDIHYDSEIDSEDIHIVNLDDIELDHILRKRLIETTHKDVPNSKRYKIEDELEDEIMNLFGRTRRAPRRASKRTRRAPKNKK
jgi:hypothetical protein